MIRVALFTIAVAVAWLTGATVAAAESASINVSGANNATLKMTITGEVDGPGTSLRAYEVRGGSIEVTFDVQGDRKEEGGHDKWKAGGLGIIIEVRSNTVWNGTVMAAESPGPGVSYTSAVVSGVLKYVEGDAPAANQDCDEGMVLTPDPAPWKTGVPPGKRVYAHRYCYLAVGDDDPGSLTTIVSYTASQS